MPCTLAGMSTVPAAAAALLFAPIGAPVAAGRALGARAEVDVHAWLGAPQGQMALDYLAAARRLWARRPGPAVTVRQELSRAVQVTGKVGRCDLDLHLRELAQVPGLGTVASMATAEQVDVGALEELLDALGGSMEAGEGALSVRVPFVAAPGSPAWLGGAALPGELRRVAELSVRHAAWRDRRVRRLAAVRVVSEQLWPDPAPWRARLAAAPVPALA